MPWLEWLDRQQDVQETSTVPYRLLEPVAKLGYGDPESENLLIEGDSLAALKALLPYYGGSVKCIFIDPPYNTKSAFEHYDDNLEHAKWLSMMYPRLIYLRDLLRHDGSLWVTLDDREAHYFKVVADEVLGRKNFVANAIWEKSDSPKMDSTLFSSRHDHLFVYARDIDRLKLHRVQDPNALAHYKQVDDQGRRYYTKPLRAMGSGEDTREARPSMFFKLTAPDGTEVWPMKPDGSEGRWRWGPKKVEQEKDRIDWVKGRNGWTANYRIYADTSQGRPPETIFPHGLVGSNRTAKAEVKAIFGEETTFTTPKPEGLIRHILELATDPGDLVLDSFLGSGTTAAVAHKMGRRWIGIELGEHAQTLCCPRLKAVVDGEQGGISKSVKWTGGGGFHFYRLGPTVFDVDNQIRQDIPYAHLAAHVWFIETGEPRRSREKDETPLLGIHEGTAYYLLYNGILGDKRVDGGNVLTLRLLSEIPAHEGPKVVYGEATRLSEERLASLGVVFKQIPYELKAT
ncbi:site-specific DNA-methyltransferase [Luteimonas sp. RD2P54]|uniref:Site-specific DNA-methyltransferase n=1 Tax=Luteimonas endophytica TaxID=3042023 RepID=A0ABT6JCB6_9GAMM|nr:site-specific DNA-methyltransferase [Luteimonas endophytica]MDH5824210.1 site-specific DNA-methyltransferase [Luteimonas endophytica]